MNRRSFFKGLAALAALPLGISALKKKPSPSLEDRLIYKKPIGQHYDVVVADDLVVPEEHHIVAAWDRDLRWCVKCGHIQNGLEELEKRNVFPEVCSGKRKYHRFIEWLDMEKSYCVDCGAKFTDDWPRHCDDSIGKRNRAHNDRAIRRWRQGLP